MMLLLGTVYFFTCLPKISKGTIFSWVIFAIFSIISNSIIIIEHDGCSYYLSFSINLTIFIVYFVNHKPSFVIFVYSDYSWLFIAPKTKFNCLAALIIVSLHIIICVANWFDQKFQKLSLSLERPQQNMLIDLMNLWEYYF